MRRVLATVLATALALQPVAAQNTPYFRLGTSSATGNGGSTDPGNGGGPPNNGGNGGVLSYPDPVTMRAGSTQQIAPTTAVFDPSAIPQYSEFSPFPSGFSIDTWSGTIMASPASAGSYPLSVVATDMNSGSWQGQGNLTVNAVPALAANSPGPQSGRVGAPFSATFTASNVIGSEAWSLSQPAGLTASGATLSGTPTSAGSYPVTATVTDSFDGAQASVTETFTFTQIPVTVSGATTLRVGETLSLHASATGLLGAPAWTVDNAPGGMTAAADGTVSWTPASAGTYSGIQIRVTDTDGAWGVSSPIAVTVQPPLGALALTGYAADYYVAQGKNLSVPAPTITGGQSPYAVSLSGLPAGMAGSSDGSASGVPSAVGDFAVSADATDSQPTPAHAAGGFAVHVNAPLAISVAQATYSATVSQAVSVVPTVTGGRAPFSFSLSSGTTGNGLSFDTSNGSLSGSPVAAATQSFTVQVQDANGDTAAATYAVDSRAALTIAAASLPYGTTGVAYSSSFSASGGKAPYVWSLASGTLPAGLTLAASGALSGTPSVAGSSVFSAAVSDADGRSATTSGLTLVVIDPLTLSLSQAPQGTATQGAAISPVAVTVTGGYGTPSLSFSGTAPDGLTLSGGTLAGVPTRAGTYSFAIVATDQAPGVANTKSTFTYAMSVAGPLTAAVYPDATGANGSTETGSKSFAPSQSAAGGSAPIGYALVGAPSWATVDSAGVVTVDGTAPSGSYSIAVRASDSAGATADGTLSLDVNPAPTAPLYAAATGANGATATAAKSFPVVSASTAGTGVKRYRLFGSPTGFTIDQNTGTVTSGSSVPPGSYNLLAYAVDANNVAGPNGTLPVEVNPAPSPAFYASTTNTSGVTKTVPPQSTASGGTGTLRYALVSPPPAAALSIDQTTGVITEGPTAIAGLYNVTVSATDANGVPAVHAFDITVNGPLVGPSYTDATGPAAATLTGVKAFTPTAAASGGTAPYSFSVASAPASSALSVDASGKVTFDGSGAQGSFTVTVTTTDTSGASATSTFALTVNPVPTAPTYASGYAATTGTPASFAAVTASSGGTGTLGYSASVVPSPSAGSISTGASGSISVSGSVPSGTYTVKIHSTDTNGVSSPDSADVQVSVATALSVSTNSLASTYQGATYSASLSSVGGSSPVTWSLTVGGAPVASGGSIGNTGLVFSSSGTISGTVSGSATTPGTIVATATDSAGRTASSGNLTLTVYPALTAFSYAAATGTSGATQGKAKSFALATAPTGGTGTYAYSPVSVPSGVTVDPSTGAITVGTSASAGTGKSATVLVTSGAQTKTATFSFDVNAGVTGPSYAAANLPQAGGSVTPSSTASGGTGAISYTLQSVAPASSAFSVVLGTGAITATSPSAGTYTVTVAATDANGATSTGTLAATVWSNPALSGGPIQTSGTAGTAITPVNFTVSGGKSPFVGNLAGNFPAGLTVSTSGSTLTVSGSPSTAGSYSYSVIVQDALGQTATSAQTMAVQSVVPGSSTKIDTSSCTITVPAYNTLTVELWGGGGSPWRGLSVPAVDGGSSSIPALGLVAGGGKGAYGSSAVTNSTPPGGAGGVASGGNTSNINGNAGGTYGNASPYGSGGGAGNGGGDINPWFYATGYPSNGHDGSYPGGGGAGLISGGIHPQAYAGGGGGAYVKSVYSSATGPAPGTVLSCTVGAGAAGAVVNGYSNGNGQNGLIKFTWN